MLVLNTVLKHVAELGIGVEVSDHLHAAIQGLTVDTNTKHVAVDIVGRCGGILNDHGVILIRVLFKNGGVTLYKLHSGVLALFRIEVAVILELVELQVIGGEFGVLKQAVVAQDHAASGEGLNIGIVMSEHREILEQLIGGGIYRPVVTQQTQTLLIGSVYGNHIGLKQLDQLEVVEQVGIVESVDLTQGYVALLRVLIHQILVQEHVGVLTDHVVVRNCVCSTVKLCRGKKGVGDVFLDLLGRAVQLLIQRVQPAFINVVQEHLLAGNIHDIHLIRNELGILDDRHTVVQSFGLLSGNVLGNNAAFLSLFVVLDGLGNGLLVNVLGQELYDQLRLELRLCNIVQRLVNLFRGLFGNLVLRYDPHSQRFGACGSCVSNAIFDFVLGLVLTSSQAKRKQHHQTK